MPKSPLERKEFRLGLLSSTCLVAASFLLAPLDQAKAQDFVIDTDGQSETIVEGETFIGDPTIVSWEGANNADFTNEGSMFDAEEAATGFLVDFIQSSDGNSVTVGSEGNVNLNDGVGFLNAVGDGNSFSNFTESFSVTDTSGFGNPVVQSTGNSFSFLNEGEMSIGISGVEEMVEPFSVFSFTGDNNEVLNNGGISVWHAEGGGDGGSVPGDYRVFNLSGMGNTFTNNAEVSISTDYTAFVWSEGNNPGTYFENGTVNNSGYGGIGYKLIGDAMDLTVNGQIYMTGGGSVGVFFEGAENSLFVGVDGVISSRQPVEMGGGEMYNVGFWSSGNLGNLDQQFVNLGLIEATGDEAVAVRMEGNNNVFTNDFLPPEEMAEPEGITPELISEGYAGNIYANALGFGNATGVEVDGNVNIFTNRGFVNVENQGENFFPNNNNGAPAPVAVPSNVEEGFDGVAGYIAFGDDNTFINEIIGEVKVNGFCEGECEDADALGIGFFINEGGLGNNSLFNDGKIVAVGDNAYGVVNQGDGFTFQQGEEGFLHAVASWDATGLVSDGDNGEIFLGGRTLIIGGKDGWGGGTATGVIIDGDNNNFGMGSSLEVQVENGVAQGIVNLGAGNTYNFGSESHVNVYAGRGGLDVALGFSSVDVADEFFISESLGNTNFTNAGEFYVDSTDEEYSGGISIGFNFLGDNNDATFTEESHVEVDGGFLSIGAIYAGFGPEIFSGESLAEGLAPLFGQNNSFTNNGDFHVSAMEESFAFGAGVISIGNGFEFLNTGAGEGMVEDVGGISTQDIEEFSGGFSVYTGSYGLAINLGVVTIGTDNSIVNTGDMFFGTGSDEWISSFAVNIGIINAGVDGDVLNNGHMTVYSPGSNSTALGIAALGDGHLVTNDRINEDNSVLDVYGTHAAIGGLLATTPILFDFLPEGPPTPPQSPEDLVGSTFINNGDIYVSNGMGGGDGFAAGILADGYFHTVLNTGDIYVNGGFGVGIGTVPPAVLESFSSFSEGEVLTGYSIGGTFTNIGLLEAYFSGVEEMSSAGIGVYGYENFIDNQGEVDFYGNGYGIFISGGGNVGVNSGTVFATTGDICEWEWECDESFEHVIGIALESEGISVGSVGTQNIEDGPFGNTFTNNGEVFVSSEDSATGVYMYGDFNSFFNNGLIEVTGQNESFGIDAWGNHMVFNNTGTIKLFNDFENPNDGALGVISGYDILFDNSGLIDGSMPFTMVEGETIEQSTPFARGLEFFLDIGPIMAMETEEMGESGPPLVFNNSGTILTTGNSFFGSPGNMGGLRPGYQTVFIGSEGGMTQITSTNLEEGDYPLFVDFNNLAGGVIERTDSSEIIADNEGGGTSVAVFIDTPYGWRSDIDIRGVIRGGYGSLFTGIGHDDILNRGVLDGDVDTDHMAFGKVLYDCEDWCEEEMGGNDTIINQGSIFGDVYMRGGSDTFVNQGIVESDVDLGSGDDFFVWSNGSGGGDSSVDGTIFGGEGFDHFDFNSTSQTLAWDNEKFQSFEALWVTGDTLVIEEGTEVYFQEAGIDGGTLQVDGNLGIGEGEEEFGTLTIENGGILKGSGTVEGNVDNQSGSVLPGNSIETIIVAGDFTQGAGGSITFEVNADGSNDLLDVGGDAFLDGEIVIVLEATNLPFATPGLFTLIETGGEVFGGFASVSGLDGTFWDPSLFINPADVVLSLALESFNQPTGTPSQQNLGTILDSKIQSFGAGSMLGMYLFDLANTQMTQAGPIMDMALNHGVSNLATPVFQNIGSLMNQVAQYNNHVKRGEWSTFITGFGQFGNMQSDGNARAFQYDGSGAVVGITYGAGQNTQIGVFAGASFIDMQTFFQGHNNYDDVQIGVFASWVQEKYTVEGVVAVGFGDFDTSRTINTGGLLPIKTALGTTDTTSIGAHLEIGFIEPFNGFLSSSWLVVTPAIMVDIVHLNMDGFTETGTVGDLGLVIKEISTTDARISVGANFVVPDTGRFYPNFGLFYVLDAGDRDRAAGAGFIADNSMMFTFFGVRSDTHAGRVNAGINVDLGSNIWFGVNYNGYFSGVEEAHRIDGTLKWIW